MKHKKYEVCRYCGAHLDHGEKCGCREPPGMIWFENLIGEIKGPHEQYKEAQRTG